MTVTLRAAGTPTAAAAAANAINPSPPAGWASGDISEMWVGVRPDTVTIPSSQNGWTKVFEVTGGDSGAGFSSDSGTSKVACFTRTDSPVAPGNIAFTGLDANSAACAVINIYQKAAGKNWDITKFTGVSDNAHGTNYVAVTGGINLELTAADLLTFGHSYSGDGGTPSADAITVPGMVVGAHTVRAERAVQTGHDMRLRTGDQVLTSGASSGPPTHSYTTLQGGSGVTAFLRLKEVDPPPPEIPINVEIIGITETEMTLRWEPPSSGTAPTSYEVRKDGGAPTDVGLVLTNEFTGLTENTEYDLEVRSKAASGTSAWVLQTATTLSGADPSTAANFLQRVREDAATFLGIELLSSMDTNSLLHQYWSAKSGLSNPSRYSIQDHVLVAGKKHWLKDVTYN